MGLVWGSFAYCPELKCREPGPDRTGKGDYCCSVTVKSKLLGELESAMGADFSLKFRSSWGELRPMWPRKARRVHCLSDTRRMRKGPM